MGLGDVIVVGITLLVFVVQQVWFHWDLYEATATGLSANHTSCRADARHDGELVYLNGCEVLAQSQLLTAAGLEAFGPFFSHSSGTLLQWSVHTWERHLVNETRCNDQPSGDDSEDDESVPVHCYQALVHRGHWVRSPVHGSASAVASDFLVGASGEEASAYGLDAGLLEQLSEQADGFLRQPPADARFPAASAHGPPLDAARAYVDGDSLTSYRPGGAAASGEGSRPSYGDVKVTVRLFQLPRAPAQVTLVARQARSTDGRAVLRAAPGAGWAADGNVSLDDMAENNGLPWAGQKWFVLAGAVEVLVVLMFTANMIQGHPCKADEWVFLAGLCMLMFVNGIAWLPFDVRAAEYWAGGAVGVAVFARVVVYIRRWREARAAAERTKASQVHAREPLLGGAEPLLAGPDGCNEEAV